MSQQPDSVAAASAANYARMQTPLVRRQTLLRYGIAAAAVLAAFLLPLKIFPTLGQVAPLAPSMGVVLAVSYWLGPGPGIFSTIISAILADWFLLTPGTLIFGNLKTDHVRLVLFLL